MRHPRINAGSIERERKLIVIADKERLIEEKTPDLAAARKELEEALRRQERAQAKLDKLTGIRDVKLSDVLDRLEAAEEQRDAAIGRATRSRRASATRSTSACGLREARRGERAVGDPDRGIESKTEYGRYLKDDFEYEYEPEMEYGRDF